MKKTLATASLLSTVLLLSACSSFESNTKPVTQSKTSWQKCALVGGAVWGIPAAAGSLATGGVAALAGALAAGVGCAHTDATDVLFDFDSAALDMKDQLILNQVAEDMGKSGRIKVVGYTCDIGPESHNQRLSENRAEAVKEYLMSRGIEEGRIITEGMGERNPKVENDSDENRQLNRRVEMVITR